MTPFSDAIRKLLSEGNGYDAVVQAMLNQALTGDVRAAQYLTDRLEGRPIQSVLVSKPEDSQPIEERLRVALDYARARKAELEK